ncbi:CLUMA_CG002710, isoform A [Clunio marinus]|uniref:CLUMA_CG002710, isoform A n=1 Tax=Clunio marinus TaxID=568069 RepID=A0A1J1HRS2_9DIPT|nr:CLUMA_CG002710, isoform A [Clunio marinus]
MGKSLSNALFIISAHNLSNKKTKSVGRIYLPGSRFPHRHLLRKSDLVNKPLNFQKSREEDNVRNIEMLLNSLFVVGRIYLPGSRFPHRHLLRKSDLVNKPLNFQESHTEDHVTMKTDLSWKNNSNKL